jgi:tetratricopeptide (TPR) repeat protein
LRTRVLFLLLLMLVAGLAGAQNARPGGGTVPKAPPDRSASIAERISWLAANPEHVAVADLFADVLNEARTVADLDRIRREVVPTLIDDELKREGTRQLAAVYRSARQLRTAATLYAQSYGLSRDSDLDSLFAHAQILFELGEFSQADIEARSIVARTTNYSLKRRAFTLAARIAYEEGNTEQALEMLETLASLVTAGTAPADLVEVETLLLLRQILELSDDPGAVERADDLLVRIFPESIAAQLIREESRLLSLPGLPSALLLSPGGLPEDGTSTTGDTSPADPLTVRRDQQRLSAIQVGSFGDAENAQHLTADLQRLGLLARSEEVAREGATLHQVIVSIPGGTTENAARILSTLRENGYDGFMVY